jgi:hypothetical protein
MGQILPLSRVKRMIKHVNDTRNVPEDQQTKAVSADAAFLIGRATVWSPSFPKLILG